jgi:hypothetical protein
MPPNLATDTFKIASLTAEGNPGPRAGVPSSHVPGVSQSICLNLLLQLYGSFLSPSRMQGSLHRL